MQNFKVKCPNCKRISFVTTDKYDPNITPNGAMVRCTLPFHIDWLTKSTTKVAEMTCPRCLAQLAPKGRLTVIKPVVTIRPCDVVKPPSFNIIESDTIPEGEILVIPKPPELSTQLEDIAASSWKVKNVGNVQPQGAFLCPVCKDGRQFKSQIALNGHMKKHEKGR